MNVHMARGLGLLLLTMLAVGCGSERLYSLRWPGVATHATTTSGEEPSFASLSSRKLTGDELPAFSVRFPGGRIITPDEFTVAKLESHGAKESMRFIGDNPPPDRLIGRRITSSAGTLSAVFDAQGRLQSISIRAHGGEGRIFVGDRSGRRMIPLPASRDELVELFGEPEYEKDIDTTTFGPF
jgi:hypothetical protein